MGCGCGKNRNVTRSKPSNKTTSSSRIKNNVKQDRRQELKKIRIAATKRTAPKK